MKLKKFFALALAAATLALALTACGSRPTTPPTTAMPTPTIRPARP